MTDNVTPLRPQDEPRLPALYSATAEQALLGALLVSNRVYDDVCEIVAQDDFGLALHGRIFAALGEMIVDGKVANPVTLGPAFDGDEALKGANLGAGYLFNLAKSAVTLSNARDYAEHIADLARRRRLIEICQGTIADASDVKISKPAHAIVEETENLLFQMQGPKNGAGGLQRFTEVMDTGLTSIEDAYKRQGQLRGPTSGLVGLDKELGGFAPGDLYIVAARPSMGKSALVWQMLIAAARKGTRCDMFSLEMNSIQLGRRAFSFLADVPGESMRTGRLDDSEWRKLMEAHQSFSGLPISIDESPGLSLAQIAQRARRQHRRNGTELIAIDHIQLMAGHLGSRPDRRLEIEHISGGLKRLAKELWVPIIAVSQLSRAVESRDDKRPNLADLRESGSIEQDADTVMFVFREEYYLRDAPMQKDGESAEKFDQRVQAHERHKDRVQNLADVIIAKNRLGMAPRTVKLIWDPGYTRFRDRAFP